jgi:hypothetical protein
VKCLQNVFVLRLCSGDDDGLGVISNRRTHVICVRSAHAVSSICFAHVLYLSKIWCLQGCIGSGSYRAGGPANRFADSGLQKLRF